MDLVRVEAVDQKEQRYPTVGDYLMRGKTLVVRVSKMRDWRYMVLVLIHELVEAALCRERKISYRAITRFDVRFEKNRSDDSEPGDDPKAPYHLEHVFATKIEKMVAKELGVEWGKYEKALNSL